MIQKCFQSLILIPSLLLTTLTNLRLSGDVSTTDTIDENLIIAEATAEHPTQWVSSKVAQNKFAPGFTVGMWVWHKDYVIDDLERIEMLDFCHSHGIRRIFIQVHLEQVHDGRYALTNPLDWEELLLMANDLGIYVEALDGSNDMAFEANRPNTLARLKAVLDFNESQPLNARFSGIHYDIEPYTSSAWENNDNQSLAVELLDTLAELKTRINEADPSLTFANDIPFWYDSKKDHLIDYNGNKKYLNEHIQDISDYVGIMSYRRRMVGTNSTTEISQGELDYGIEIGRPVYLSIETVELTDTPQITFYGRNAVEIASAARELTQELKSKPSFGGVFLHEYRTLRKLSGSWNFSALDP